MTCIRSVVLLLTFVVAGQLLACGKRNRLENVPPSPRASLAPAASASGTAPVAEGWLGASRAIFEANRALGKTELPLARVRFELPPLSATFVARNCATPSDCRSRTRYVRVRQSADQLDFLADCGAFDEEHLLDELAKMGPFRLVTGKLAPGQRLRLVGKQGQRMSAELELFMPEVAASRAIAEEYLYARSVSVAFAQSRGFSPPLLGKESCSAGANASVCEADVATQGSPLAALQALGSPPHFVAEAEWLRQRTLLPVSTGFFQNFCGRAPLGPWSKPTEQDGAYARARAQALTVAGLDVERLLTGAAWTGLGQRVPQVDMTDLSWMIRTLGRQASTGPRFRQVAADASVSWRNRLRARYLEMSFTSAPDQAALLREFRVMVPRCASTLQATCSPTADDDRLDLTCVAHTLGFPNVLCMTG